MKKITIAILLSLTLIIAAGFCYTRMTIHPHIAGFVIKHKKNKTLLMWRSVSTPYLHAFILEKSLDGKHFFPFDTINAVRDTKRAFTYVVSDEKAGKYYRLSFTNKLDYKYTWKTIVNTYSAATTALARDLRCE